MNPVTIIAGPGRSGTTFLWLLLKELGHDTGDDPEFFRRPKGGIPAVVKGTAGIFHNLDKYVTKWDLEPRHVLVALRRLEPLTNSRMRMRKRYSPSLDIEALQALREAAVERIPLCVGRLMFHLIEGGYPYTVIVYPESARDVDYCYEKITEVMGSIPYEDFVAAWTAVVDADLIHEKPVSVCK